MKNYCPEIKKIYLFRDFHNSKPIFVILSLLLTHNIILARRVLGLLRGLDRRGSEIAALLYIVVVFAEGEDAERIYPRIFEITITIESALHDLIFGRRQTLNPSNE